MSSSPSPTLQESIEAFRQHLAISRSQHTVEAYTTALRHFEAYCAERHRPADRMPVSELRLDMAFSFIHWLQGTNPVSRPTRDHYLTALTRFFRWLLLKNQSSYSVADYAQLQEELADFRGRRPPRPLPHVPAEDTVHALLQAAYAVPAQEDPDTPQGHRAMLLRLRNIALLEALRSTGARVGEIVALRRGDVLHERQAAVVTGKGQKQRLVYFDKRAWTSLTQYLQARDGGGGRPGLPLFSRHDRGAGKRVLPITTNTVRSVIVKLCASAGVDEAVTPHLLRHRFATRVLSATHDLAATQDLLGHASPTTTRIYARLADEDTEKAHRQAQESGKL